MLHYTNCSLRNVWLENGYRKRRTVYGRAASIEDVEQLHKTIGMALVRHKPGCRALSSAEFRFLRKEMDLSHARLGRYIGISEQAVAKWDKQGRTPRHADRFLQELFREYVEGNARIQELVNRLAEMDRVETDRFTFDHTEYGWREPA